MRLPLGELIITDDKDKLRMCVDDRRCYHVRFRIKNTGIVRRQGYVHVHFSTLFETPYGGAVDIKRELDLASGEITLVDVYECKYKYPSIKVAEIEVYTCAPWPLKLVAIESDNAKIEAGTIVMRC